LAPYTHYDMAEHAGKVILLVDDNVTNLAILKRQFEDWKFKSEIASCGDEALFVLSGDETIDLVITDMQMPDMDGVMLAKLIRDKYPRIPIILLSSIGEEFKKDLKQLFFSVLNKPIKQHHLSMAIQNELKHKQYMAANDLKSSSVLSVDFAAQNPASILVAEDNLINQKLVMRILEKLGFKAGLVSNGQQVLDELGKAAYDIILMDIQMPELDGLEATRRIRKMGNINQPYIVAMTANAMPEDRDECYAAGMDNYVSKPVKLELLVNILRDGFLAKQKV